MGKQVKRMIEGKIYSCREKDEERDRLRSNCKKFLDEFNATSFLDSQKREELARGIFKSVGNGFQLNKPFYCDYGCNISIGDNFYANYDCIFIDVNLINIGNNVFIGPRVCIYTACHPIDKDVRNKHFVYGKEIIIGNDVWIGGNCVINPGVKIGNNVVIGSNSTVTHDIPDNVVAFGNPCRVIRKITDEDKIYWKKQEEEYYNEK